MNIIDRRDKGNEHRKRMKEQYDSAMKLSVQESGEWYPLLQEGMITYSDGTPYFYIMRGTLSRFYDELPADYEGSINVGHTDLASFPDRVVGRWTKANLRLVDIEDGRQKLETNLPLNREHPTIKALEQSDFDVGLSVEMSMDVNWDLTDNQELNPFGVPIVERLFVYDYAIVGNAGDVNSMGVHLKGGSELQMNELAKLLAKEGGSNIAEITKLIDRAMSDAEPVEETEETTNLEEEEAAEETSEETKEEETSEEETSEEAEEAEEKETPEETPATDETFMSIMQQLAEELKALREENASLKEQLAAKNEAEAEFVKKFKKLSVSLPSTSKTPKPVAEHKVYTDGIGE